MNCASRLLVRGPLLLTIVSAVLSGLTAGLVEAEESAKPSQQFSAATYNINWGNPNLPQVVAAIKKADAELVFLQETNAQSEAYLRRQLGGAYRYTYFRGDRNQYGAERFGFLSKSPITGFTFLPAKHGLFGTWIGQTKLGGGRLQIVNLHLDPIRLERGAGLRGFFAALAAVEKTHAQEIDSIYNKLAPDVPTLIAGDFNSTSWLAAPKFLVERGFADSFASVTKTPDSHPTWHWPFGPTELSARIDYLFHTRHLRTVESRTLDGNASDHRLVVSRLEWRKDEEGEAGKGDSTIVEK